MTNENTREVVCADRFVVVVGELQGADTEQMMQQTTGQLGVGEAPRKGVRFGLSVDS